MHYASKLVRSMLLGIVVSLGAMPVTRAAEAPLFAFVDAEGVVHITDRLGDVPEPYYSVYRAREAERQRQAQAGADAARVNVDAASMPTPNAEQLPTPKFRLQENAAADQQRARSEWQATMAQWRRELVDTAGALHAAETEAQSAANPLLKETPQGRIRYLASQERLEKARAKAVQARDMVVKVLPERAKKEHVPPQWLTP